MNDSFKVDRNSSNLSHGLYSVEKEHSFITLAYGKSEETCDTSVTCAPFYPPFAQALSGNVMAFRDKGAKYVAIAG